MREGGRRRRALWVVGAVAVSLWAALTAKLFVWPALDPVDGLHADAVLVLGGPGPRLRAARQLAAAHVAPVVLVSVPSMWRCPRMGPGVQVRCFRPDPFSTQGEARYFAEQARREHWRSVVVVASVPQSTRARLRVERCFPGTVKVVGARLGVLRWAYGVLYEWGALAKALVWQRSC